MKSNLLYNKLIKLQNEYLILLKSVLPTLESHNFLYALDEIYLFWLQQEDLTDMFIDHTLADNDNYFFTGATHIDINDKDHYPFVLLGKYHVFDDPLFRYSDLCIKAHKTEIGENMFEKVRLCIKNNIEILENGKLEILVLPVRILNKNNPHDIFSENAIEFFLSLFNEIKSIEEYHEKCMTIEDVVHYLDKEMSKTIYFSDIDDISIPFEIRFADAKEKIIATTGFHEANEAFLVFSHIYGYYMQALDILYTSLIYNIYPVIRTKISLNALIRFVENIPDEKIKFQLLTKAISAYLLYIHCDRIKVSAKGFDHFCEAAVLFDFYKKLSEKIANLNVKFNASIIGKLKDIVDSTLEEFYSHLNLVK